MAQLGDRPNLRINHAKPRSVAALLESTFRRFHIAHKVKQYSIFEHWPEIVGEELAQIAIPEKIIRNRIIVIRVLDASWAQELTLQKQTLLDHFARIPGAPVLEDIRFIIGGPRNSSELKALKQL